MYPTQLFGTLALALAVRHAVSPKSQLMPLIVGSTTASLFAGCLGLITGLMATVRYIEQAPEPKNIIFLYGLGESLNNVALATFIAMLVSMAAAVGSFRAKLATASS